MKKALRKIEENCYYYKDRKRVEGVHNGISGNVSEISGDVSRIYGNVNEISGDVSGIYGNVSRISGNVSDCEVTDEDREKGINIQDLINNN